jgi:hypothetical protein
MKPGFSRQNKFIRILALLRGQCMLQKSGESADKLQPDHWFNVIHDVQIAHGLVQCAKWLG